MTRNQGRDRLKAMASWIKEEAVEAGEESAGSLVAMKHIYRKAPEKYDEIKQHYGAYVGRSKAKQRKALARAEMEYQANLVTVETVLTECYEPEPSSEDSDTKKKGAMEYHEPGLKRPKSKSAKNGNANSGQRSKVSKKPKTAVRPSEDDELNQPTHDSGETADNSNNREYRDRSPQCRSTDRRGRSPGRRSPEGRRGRTPPGGNQRRPVEKSEEQSPHGYRGRGWNATRSFRGGRPSAQASWRGCPTRGRGGPNQNRNRRADMLAQILDFVGY